MIFLTKQQIDTAIPKVKVGLEKYLWLQNEVSRRNVALDREFQQKFNGFYRVRRNQEWQKEFYKLLEVNKNTNTSFINILSKLYKKTNRIEASFVSKLIATINHKMPVIDKIVFANLNLRLPPTTTKNRILIISEHYQTLNKEFLEFLKTENGRYLVKQFTKKYPKAKITKVKMLDLILWQTRS